MVPKSLALQTAERIALWLTPPMLWIQTLLYPFVIALNGVAQPGAAPVRHPPRSAHSADQYYTSEELQLIVEESEEQGALRSESGQVLQELFEFGELTAGEVMVPRVRITGIPVGAGAGRPARDSRHARRTRAIRSTKGISITSSARITSRICCGCC